MKTIIYSADKRYYYVKEIARGGSDWLSVQKFDEVRRTGWIDNAHQYDGYYRAGLPFPFWKVKSGERVRVRNTHELVIDYQKAEDSKK